MIGRENYHNILKMKSIVVFSTFEDQFFQVAFYSMWMKTQVFVTFLNFIFMNYSLKKN